MEKNAILAAVLSIAVLIAWEYFYLRPIREESIRKQEIAKREAKKEQPSPLASKPLSSPPPAQVEKKSPQTETKLMAISEKRVKVDVGSAIYEFTNVGAALVSARLKKYLGDDKKEPIELVTGANRSISPLYFFGNGRSARLNQASFVIEGGDVELTPSNPEGKVRFVFQDGSGLSAEKTFSFRYNSYVIRADVKVNGTEKGRRIGLGWGPRLGGEDSNTYGGVIEGPMSMVGKELEYDAPEKGKPVVHGSDTRWTSLQTKYFIAAFIPRSGASGAEIRLLAERNEKRDYAVVVPISTSASNNKAVIDIFIGPKETDLLSALNVNLEDALDYGMFSFIARPLMFVLRVSYSFTGNWGVAIILLTVLIKIIFYPLTQVSMRNMRNMQKLQPKMTQLREIYKDNKEKMNQEVMALYREHKVNPMMGCLPMLVQIPVFFGLYQALLVSIELRQAPFFGWIQDLSVQDPFHVFTILMGASMFLQQKMTPTTGDPTQAKMMMFMPIIFTAMFVYYPVPVGLVIYWFMNNLLSIIQQYFVNRSISPPKLAEDS